MLADSGSLSVWMRVCAWCGITLPGEDVTPEPAGASPRITHGICPDCKDEFIRAVAAQKATARPAGTTTNGAC
jgi:hypothetical protein